MQRVGLVNRDSFRKNWLKPAIDLGVIELTIPDKPSSKSQRYRRRQKQK